jgi:F-type H+-transporting ATPase subunit delta
VSAKKLESEVKDKIRKSFLDKKIKEVEIKERVDSALIGGLKIRIGDTIYDGSVSNYILKIKEKLK